LRAYSAGAGGDRHVDGRDRGEKAGEGTSKEGPQHVAGGVVGCFGAGARLTCLSMIGGEVAAPCYWQRGLSRQQERAPACGTGALRCVMVCFGMRGQIDQLFKDFRNFDLCGALLVPVYEASL
jgi:hypothetical protein